MNPVNVTNNTTIYQGDCIEIMRSLPEKIVQTCVTSPPYFGLRDYGVDGQIGLEQTPDEYVAKLVAVFREVKRILKDDGTLWLNLGDSYFSSIKGSGGSNPDTSPKQAWKGSENGQGFNVRKISAGDSNCKPKDLIGIPWRVAFALQADGWYLRQDIIWHKPNPMPESVKDRCTKAHEYIFLLSKSERYYFDGDAIKEPLKESSIKRNQTGWNGDTYRSYTNGKQNNFDKFMGSDAAKLQTHRNKRSVWSITTKPYKGAHFATFPPDLIKPCIQAGAREGDIVLDPFGGSGTTGMVSEELNRKAILCELNANYIPLAIDRINKKRVVNA